MVLWSTSSTNQVHWVQASGSSLQFQFLNVEAPAGRRRKLQSSRRPQTHSRAGQPSKGAESAMCNCLFLSQACHLRPDYMPGFELCSRLAGKGHTLSGYGMGEARNKFLLVPLLAYVGLPHHQSLPVQQRSMVCVPRDSWKKAQVDNCCSARLQ